MSTPKTASAPHKRPVSPKAAAAPDTRAEMAEVMKKLRTIEMELGALLERSLCESLQATGKIAEDVNSTVRSLLGSAFGATREVSQSLLQAGARTAETSRATARDAAATVQDFGHIATEAVRQVIAGTTQGLAEVRSSHARRTHH